MTGFSITCLRCGATMTIKPGVRDREKEPIGFGTEQIFENDWIRCRCGNAIESEDRFETEEKLVEYWVDVSKRPADESTLYGNDCPKGVCEF